jgi:hypothetical protein
MDALNSGASHINGFVYNLKITTALPSENNSFNFQEIHK